MSFKDVLGQDHVVHSFQKTIEKGLVAHAYIFSGSDGIGKSLFTKQFAKMLNCSVNHIDSCDKCINCRKIDTDNSSDVHLISLEKSKKFLGIKDIKALQETAALKPVELNYKIFIFKDANRLSEEAFNSLLKTLEEPSPSSIIILLASSIDSLPETIVSRCQIIRFFNLSKNIINEILKNRYKDTVDNLEWFARIADGSAGKAINFIEEDLYKKNASIIKSLSNLSKDDNFDLSQQIHDWIPVNKKTLEEKRAYLKIILGLILCYYKDLLMFKIEPYGKIQYFNIEQKSLIEKQSLLFAHDDIAIIMDQVITAVNNLESNANTNFIFENLLIKIANIKNRNKQVMCH